MNTFDPKFSKFIEQLIATGFVMNPDNDRLYFNVNGLAISVVPYEWSTNEGREETLWFQFNGLPEYDEYCNNYQEFLIALYNASRAIATDQERNRIKSVLGI